MVADASSAHRTQRIIVVTPWDTSSPRSWSGVIEPMVAALRAEFATVDVLETSAVTATIDRVRARALGMRGRLHLPAWSPPTAGRRSEELAARLAALPDELPVVALAATPELLRIPAPRRIVQVTDSSFAALVGSYPAYARLTSRGLRTAEGIERTVADRTEHFLAATAWSRDRLQKDAGVAAETLTVARFGPAITPTRPAPPCPPLGAGPMRLLLVASDWERKGGDLALDVVAQLRDRGIDVSLTVVGARGRELPGNIEHHEQLDPADLSAVYSTHHALLETSSASAGGVVVTDALHHGLPVIASAIGGLTDLVRDGRTGWLVPVDGTAAPFVRTIEERVLPADLSVLSRSAATWATQEASWPVWAAAVRDVLDAPPRRSRAR